MLAEIMWILNEVKASGTNVNGSDTQIICSQEAGLQARTADGGNAVLENLGLGLLLTRNSEEASEEKANCRFVVPVEIPQGYYPRVLEASYVYDLTKTQRTQARLALRLNVGGFALWRASRTYPNGQFVELESKLSTRITLSPDGADTASLVRILCQRPEYPLPLGVEVSLEGSRASRGEELRLGQGEETTRVEVRAANLEKCP